MNSHKNLHLEELHPDVKNQPEFEEKVAAILANRRRQREEARDPKKQRVRRAVDFFSKSKIREENDPNDDIPELRSRTIINSTSSSGSKRKRVSPGELIRMLNQDTPKPKKKKKKTSVDEETMNIEENAGPSTPVKYDSHMKQLVPHQGAGRPTKVRLKKTPPGAGVQMADFNYEGEALEDIQELAPLVGAGLAAGAAALGAAAVHRAKKSVDSGVDAAKSGKKVQPSSGLSGAAYNIQKRNEMLKKVQNQSFDYEGETLEEKKLSRTAKRAARVGKPGYDAEGKPKPKGKVRAWDMDETLMRNDPKKIRVHVKDKATGKTTRSLTNQEFNTDKLNKDKEDYDFTEFRSSEKFSKASKPNKSMVKKLKKQVRRGKPVHIVTARGSFDDQPKFAKHLRKHGIEIDPGKGKGGRHVHVHRAGDMPGSDIGKKKVDIVKGLMKKHKTSGAEMYDDAAKVHRAFKTSAKETPTQPKVKTKMVQPNKKDVTQARSFKEDIDLDLIYNCILEQLITEGFASDYDEASVLVEDFSDELLEDLMKEILTMLEEDEEETNISKINYVSPYKKLQEKREIKEKYMVEKTEVTPYEYWKSFIGCENKEDFYVSEDLDDDYEEVEPNDNMTSYEYWKKSIEEAVGREAMVAANIARAKAAKEKRVSATPTTTAAATSAAARPSVVPSSVASKPSPISPERSYGTSTPTTTAATSAKPRPSVVPSSVASKPSPISPERSYGTPTPNVVRTSTIRPSGTSTPNVVRTSTIRPSGTSTPNVVRTSTRRTGISSPTNPFTRETAKPRQKPLF